jgi:hypothetical protein
VTLLDIPDCDEDFKSFIEDEPNLGPLHGGRVYYRVPANNGTWPIMRLYRAGGGKVPGEVPILQVRFAIEVLAGAVDGPSYLAVRTLSAVTESVINNIDNVLSGGTWFLNGIVTTTLDKPDPDTGRPGRVLDAVITLRSATS